MTFFVELFSALALVAVLLFAFELGRRVGKRRLAEDPERSHAGVGAVEAAVFGLLGLLLAFTFSGAWARFDARRELIVQEANAIGTAWLRLDLLSDAASLRQEFRRYVDLRIEATRAGATAPSAELAELQQRMWRRAVTEAADVRIVSGVLPALNEMFDLATTRYVAVQTHPPRIVFAMLFGLAFASSALAGYGMAGGKARSWLHIVCFTASLLATVYVSIEMEFPRRGFVRVDHYDQVLIDVRAALK
jgi:hypothetical protein